MKYFLNIIYTFLLVLCFLLATFSLSASAQEEKKDSTEIPYNISYQLILHTDSGNYQQVKEYLDYGANPNISTYDGVTPLMFAAQNGFYRIAKLLIEYNSDVNAAPTDGNTALHAAVRSNNDSIAELLMDNGAAVNKSNYQGIIPLHFAAAYGYPFLTELLLYFKSDIDYKDNQGNTPLMVSAYSGARIVSEILLENGADVNHADENGFTPLMVAAQYNDTSIVNLLLKYGANVMLRNSKGGTALALAIKYKALEAAKMLIEKGAASEDYSTTFGYVDLAKENGLHQIVPILAEKGLKKATKPGISTATFSSGFSFNGNEFMFEFGGGIVESYTKTLVELNFAFRPYDKPILEEQDFQYIQYWERRRRVGLSANKLLNIKQLPNDSFVGFSFGLSGQYSWGNYTYPNPQSKPEAFFRVSPKAGLLYNGKNLYIITSAEYLIKRIDKAKPFLYSIIFGVKINSSENAVKSKQISWIN